MVSVTLVDPMAPPDPELLTLVQAAINAAPAGTSAVAVRTLVDHHTAIRLYQKCGFQMVQDLRQTHHGRPRLYLVREMKKS